LAIPGEGSVRADRIGPNALCPHWHTCSFEADIEVSQNHSLAIVGSYEGRLLGFDITSGQVKWDMPLTNHPLKSAASCDLLSNRIWVGSSSGTLHIVDIEKVAQVHQIQFSAPLFGRPSMDPSLKYSPIVWFLLIGPLPSYLRTCYIACEDGSLACVSTEPPFSFVWQHQVRRRPGLRSALLTSFLGHFTSIQHPSSTINFKFSGLRFSGRPSGGEKPSQWQLGTLLRLSMPSQANPIY